MQWSDGKVRSERYEGTDLQVALRKYFADALEEERIRLQWENEAMRKKLSEPSQLELAEAEVERRAAAAAS